ncbi:MAG: enoyl-CoA hydratase/isomerase family protein [Acidobacteria bacterium]|nr:enoyl-CoA hydratase/isomerase family protein [Acidobacteriota bacterium]
MKAFSGQAISWELREEIVEVELHREPCNEFGSESLSDFERLVAVLPELEQQARGVIIYSRLASGFSAGADLRETYYRTRQMDRREAVENIRQYLERTHQVMNAIDASPLTTIAAVHGVTFGGGLELALACDLIIADKSARFCFPELRLGLIPGFGGIPRLNRDLGNAAVRDLLLTGRSFNVAKAQQVGLVSQVVAEGQAVAVARATARQLRKFDPATTAAAKKFLKPIPYEELRREIEIFCQLFSQPAVEKGLRTFVESSDRQPYLPQG